MLPIVALRVLRSGAQELEIAFQDVFDPQKNVAESRPAHQGCECFAVVGDSGRHRLDKVVQLVQPGLDDGMAKRFETMYVERNVVVDQKDGASAVVPGVSDVSQ